MIDAVLDNERCSIIDFLANDTTLSMPDARFCIEKSGSVIAYKNKSSEIVGCGTFRLWGKNRNKADVYIYVSSTARLFGTGNMLLKALIDTPQASALEFISTKVETNHSDSLVFFQKAGFEPWYTEYILWHNGTRQSESNLNFENYQSKYFEQYVDAIRSSFYELRRSNDFQPYYCCEKCLEKQEELENNKNNIYVIIKDEKLIASVTIIDNFIEDVFVVSDYRGRGIGREMMCFAVNKVIDSTNSPAYLSSIKWNVGPLHLYRGVGFEISKTIHYLRLFR
ncbi:MAG: GNAT family N-acetyltransferase [Clostridia bacterium]|nr:GNAT family N-acetyltransferase [Clostridia bacterium]